MSAPDYLLCLEVGGVMTEMPHPMKYDPSEQDIVTSKSGRDEKGVMWNQYVATKWTYDIAYNNEEFDEVSRVLQAFDDAPLVNGMKQIQARVYNPYDMQFHTGTYYVGDRKMSIVQWMPDRAHGKLMNLSFTLIEV